MVKIKICGMKRVEDIKYVNELKPEYVGFVFAESKRQVTLEEAKQLINLLDKKIKTVGVFKNESPQKVKSIAKYLKLNILQFHGIENEGYIKEFINFHVWKSITIEIQGRTSCKTNCYQEKLNEIGKYDIQGILLDSSVKGISGGTGISFDWNAIKKVNFNKPLILAGGLNAENIQKAIEILTPFAVDVSSGVEENGIKNFKKIKEFIEKVR